MIIIGKIPGVFNLKPDFKPLRFYEGIKMIKLALCLIIFILKKSFIRH